VQDQASVVIIGAGIVGLSTAYYLGQMGWRDVVVLDQGPIVPNRGSTSHAPGLIFQHNNSKSFCQLAQWTVQTYLQVKPPDGRAVYQVGSLEIAHTLERWHELKRKLGNSKAWGLEAYLISPSEIKRMVPIMRTDDLHGAFYVPSDVDVNAVTLCEGLMKMAAANGAKVLAETPVVDIEVKDGHVASVGTQHGRIRTETVVCAAGLWGPVVGRMAGVQIPMTPMQHLYVKTAPLKELAGAREELEHPIVRYQDKDLYFRQHYEAYGLGSYRHDPLIVDPDDLPENEHPAVFPFTPEHFCESWRDAVERIPALGDAEIVDKFNGLFSFTPDGNMNLGESAHVRGFWSAEAVWVTHGGGVGKVMAEWIAEGLPSLDLREHDINRWHPFALSKDYVRMRASRQYVEVYDIIHPLQQTENPRNLRLPPYYARLKELGAVFFEAAGWERPQWFESNANLTAADPPLWTGRNRGEWAARNWSPVIGAEHVATRERVGMFDLTPFTKLDVIGPGALDFLQSITCNEMDRPVGKVTYTSMVNPRGGIEADLTVTRLGEDRFLVVTGGGVGMHDLAWLRKHEPVDAPSGDSGQASVKITDITSKWCCIGVWGPRVRELVERVSEDDFSNVGFPYMSARRVYIGYVPALAIRISYAGELGWEIYAPTEYGLKLWDTLWEAGEAFGVTAVGGGAFDSLRLEKGYRLWGVDIHSEYNPYEAGLGFTVKLNKGEFLGRTALEQIKENGVMRKLCCMTFDDPDVVVMGKEPILRLRSGQVFEEERVLGYVTSANYGYNIGKSILYGYLPIEFSRPGTKVQVYYFGDRHPATVSEEPLFDAEMKRLKS
jgi:glycine cleavage system aminomethyltransferase T/glycine/D-amino acid oxidase-like deaminating enzyme